MELLGAAVPIYLLKKATGMRPTSGVAAGRGYDVISDAPAGPPGSGVAWPRAAMPADQSKISLQMDFLR